MPPFPELFVADTPGKVPTAAPMLVYQGLSDDVVYKVFTDQYVQMACGLGNTVEYKTFSGKDHYEENDAAEKDVLEWMQARLAGVAPATVDLLTDEPGAYRDTRTASLGSARVLSVDLPPEPSSATRARSLAASGSDRRAPTTRSTPSPCSSPSS